MQLRVIQGTLRRDRAGSDTPKPRPVAPPPPKGMDRRASATWRQLAPILRKLGLLTELDTMAFTVLCETHARCERARRRLRMIEQRRPQPHLTEQLALIRAAEVSVERAEFSFRQLAVEFGMTPGARSRLDIQAPIDGTDDEFEEFLRRGS